jgi:predicted AlkP superfamily phosphohydrolase/phosphomutase
MPTWSRIRDDDLAAGDDPGDERSGAIERAGALLAAAGITSQRIERVCEAIGADEFARRHAPPALVSAATEQVDVPTSRAYVRSRIECGVRINLEGREPDGVVPPGEYDAVRAELIEQLSGVTTPDGEPVFEDVAPREAYFDGSTAERAVDVVTVPADFEHFLSARLSGEQCGEPTEPWNHKRPGVIALVGDAVDASAALRDPHLFDVAPTVLAAMGVPRDERMDGRVLAPVEPAGERRYPRYEADDDVETGGNVEERLAELGYIERPARGGNP